MFQHISRALSPAALIVAATASLSQASVVKTNCGAPINSYVLTNNGSPPFQTTSAAFVRIPGAAVNVVVPAGTRRCVKVRISPRTLCQSESGSVTCYIRAIANNIELNPGTLSGGALRESYQWVSRLNPGTYLVQIQVRRTSTNAAANVHVDDWAADIEILR